MNKKTAIIIGVIITLLIATGAVLMLKSNNDTPLNSSSIDDAITNPKPVENEKEIKAIAIDKLKEIGEKDVVEEDVVIVEATKNSGMEYYFIVSKENTMEMRKSDYKIVRINTALVD